ncbi:Aste57867_4972 [Aphanomyces stellatus]|uniref:Aste57867_4972 protein n=1 Tax=Aphanomyces stellatus TaxID=120398 RepID=A0A485KG67_9STRA|nr:hypothetical protein As57867_004959 [Aphanomyces stellatus]VFT82060.1 Aste57867_4972 [Aphanomyces stellatus]
MVDETLTAVKMRDSSTYILSMGNFLIQDATNYICGTLAKVSATTTIGSVVHRGVVVDGITYIRGNTLSCVFGSTSTPAAAGSNDSTLTAMGYIPGRVNADMRLANASGVMMLPMYRFAARVFCTGCTPSSNLAWTRVRSHAIYGQTHALGILFERRWTAVLSLYVRLVCVLSLSACTPWLVNLVSLSQYLQPCRAFDLSDICFNSDLYVLLYVIAVLADENIAMLYSRVLNTWHQYAGADIWIELRLMAMNARWLWLNCCILKGLKWSVHFVSRTQYTGDNKVVGWCTFSSVSYVYLGMILLYFRNDFIEYGNGDNVMLTSTTQNIDAIGVELFSSWFVRAVPSFICFIFANLFVLLALNHILHRPKCTKTHWGVSWLFRPTANRPTNQNTEWKLSVQWEDGEMSTLFFVSLLRTLGRLTSRFNQVHISVAKTIWPRVASARWQKKVTPSSSSTTRRVSQDTASGRDPLPARPPVKQSPHASMSSRPPRPPALGRHRQT